ncbi:MAG: hypothetical protein ABI220_01710 [Candidatus Saccharimonadales bacterium]
MNKREVIQKLLNVTNDSQGNLGATFGGASGALGISNPLQADLNRAIGQWLERGDSTGLHGIVNTLHAVDSLTDSEYDQILKVITTKEV